MSNSGHLPHKMSMNMQGCNYVTLLQDMLMFSCSKGKVTIVYQSVSHIKPTCMRLVRLMISMNLHSVDRLTYALGTCFTEPGHRHAYI